MKKYIFLSFLLTALFISCTEQLQEDPILTLSQYPVFYASFESSDEPATRTYADPQHRIRWNKGDRVSIFNGNTINLEYMFEGETGDSTGTFRIVEEGNKSSVQTRSVSYKYAVYPYDKDCTMGEDGTLTVTFPSEQSYVPNSFGPMDNTMISISEDDTLFFRNVGGYLILKLYGDTTQVTSITLKGNKDEPICGKGYVTVPYYGIPSVRMSEEGTPTLTLLCETPIPLSASSKEYKEFWFVVPPVTFTEGFTIVIEDSEGRRMTKSTSRSVTVERNQRFRMTPLDVPALPATQFVRFEDPNFKAYCVANFDTNWDGGIDLDEAALVTSINPRSSKIFSLVGIEHFINLTDLYCFGSRLNSLDVSHNTKLRYLKCYQNNLTSLDVSQNTDLFWLYCYGNQLTSLDISHNTSLSWLNCSNNQLASLDVSHNTSLNGLQCGNNQLTSLDISHNTSLGWLDCSNNQLTSLDVSHNTSLVSLICGKNQLTSLNLDHNTSLEELDCSNNLFTALEFVHHPRWYRLDCSNNQLTSLDVSGCLMMKVLNCDNNQLTTLDLIPCPAVEFSGENNPWTRFRMRECVIDTIPNWPYSHITDWIEPVAPEVVDLGLSVDWGSFNLWANCPEEGGAYYAWGEIASFGECDTSNENLYWKDPLIKGSFSWETYKWSDGSEVYGGDMALVTKYCYDPAFGVDGFTDELLTLEEEDDAAERLLGDGWRIPTADEWDELISNCTWEYVNLNGVNGLRATSKKPGFTDRSIFFPLAGSIRFDNYETDHTHYWSSSLKLPSYYPEEAQEWSSPDVALAAILFQDGYCYLDEQMLRCYGCPIRPVKPKTGNE